MSNAQGVHEDAERVMKYWLLLLVLVACDDGPGVRVDPWAFHVALDAYMQAHGPPTPSCYKYAHNARVRVGSPETVESACGQKVPACIKWTDPVIWTTPDRFWEWHEIGHAFEGCGQNAQGHDAGSFRQFVDGADTWIHRDAGAGEAFINDWRDP